MNGKKIGEYEGAEYGGVERVERKRGRQSGADIGTVDAGKKK